MVKNLSANAGGVGSIPGLGRSATEGNGNPLQYSCLDKLMDRRAWRATVHGVSMSWTWVGIDPPPHTHIRIISLAYRSLQPLA